MIILLQGAPGSGKSTLAKKLAKILHFSGVKVIIVSADHYFYNNGTYQFDQTKLGAAHKQCQESAERYLCEGFTVIVDNTNVKRRDVRFYVDLAGRLNKQVETFRCVGVYPNIHGVPNEVVERMRNGLEDLI